MQQESQSVSRDDMRQETCGVIRFRVLVLVTNPLGVRRLFSRPRESVRASVDDSTSVIRTFASHPEPPPESQYDWGTASSVE